MTSVEQQAVEVIADHILPVTEGKAESEGLSGDRLVAVAQSRAVRNARGAVRALADAGLLAPDLPKPTKVYESGIASWFAGPESGHGYVDIGEYAVLPPDEARYLARQILAAAKYAEEEK